MGFCITGWYMKTVAAGLVAAVAAAVVIITVFAPVPGAGEFSGTAEHAGPDPGAVVVRHDAATEGATAMYSKNVSDTTPFIIADLYSGDKDDPLSLFIITPDRTIGPFTDASDGRTDGRIYLKISRAGGLKPGIWRFLVQSNRTIRIGSIDTALYRVPDIEGNLSVEGTERTG